MIRHGFLFRTFDQVTLRCLRRRSQHIRIFALLGCVYRDLRAAAPARVYELTSLSASGRPGPLEAHTQPPCGELALLGLQRVRPCPEVFPHSARLPSYCRSASDLHS